MTQRTWIGSVLFFLAMQSVSASHARAQTPDDSLAHIGRDFLWSDHPDSAAKYLAAFLAKHEDCGVSNDYGLALAWTGRLDDAKRVYGDVITRCPDDGNTARLRLANVFRWQDRPSRAALLYRMVQASANAPDVRAANAGLAFVTLQHDDNRAALHQFGDVIQHAATRAEISEARGGMGVALFRLGDPREAALALDQAAAGDVLPRGLKELRAQIREMEGARVTPSSSALHDADGTTRSQIGADVDVGTGMRTRTGIGLSLWRLSQTDVHLDAMSLSAFAEHRTSSILAIRADAGVGVVSNGWRPLTGEMRAVITPHDRIRFDVSGARILVPDNVAAVMHRLSGDYGSAGVDLRVFTSTTIAASADYTSWSSGNARTRTRFTIRHQLEGIPRVTFETPITLQWYDASFPFALYAPRRYTELGAAASVYSRINTRWQINGRVGGGAQLEGGSTWRPLGSVQLGLWRDPDARWSPKLDIRWTNSSLGSPGSFRRTSFTLAMGHPL